VRYNTVLNLWDPPHGDRVRAMLQQSLAQFQTSQRIRQLEDDIIEIGGDIAGVPTGCLIGLDAGDELLEDYRRLTSTLTTAQQRQRRTQKDLDTARTDLVAPPWQEPGRQALRKMFRNARAGMVVHHREFGWIVYLGKSARGGVGLFLHKKTIELVAEYRSIDYVPDQKFVTLPEALIAPPEDIADARTLVPVNELDNLWRRVKRLGLPDLAALAAEHQAREAKRIASELAEIDRIHQEVLDQTRLMAEAREGHPCHACPRRKEHRENLARVDQLDKERGVLSDILAREVDAEEARIRGVIRGIREVLHRFGYVHRGYATPKADMLADIFDNDGLILCELVDRGLLDSMAPEDLAEIFSWFSFDRDFRYSNGFTLPDQLVLFRRRLEDLEQAILGEERDNGLAISEGHNPTFYGAARAWCQGMSMSDITRAIDLSEGDLVMTFNKTIDLMRQVRDMLVNVLPDHPLTERLARAEKLLRRGIVEQSLTIGFNPIESPDEPETPDEATDIDG
jgi:ATP-dependent RNA helicase HelY